MKHYWLRTGFLWLAIVVSSGQAWSNDTDSSGSAAAKAVEQPAGPDLVTLNFVNADIEGVVKAVSEITHKNFVLDPRVKGTVSIVSAKPMSRSLIYQTFLSAIRMQGFTAVEGRGSILIVPEADAKLYAGFGSAMTDKTSRSNDTIKTQVFRLQHESAAQLLMVLRPLIAPNNMVTAYPSNNSLVVTDYASNLKRIEQIIESIDQPSGSEADTVMIPLHYASALDVAETIKRLLAEPAQASDPTSKFTITADARSNSILARTLDPSRLQRVRELITMLDTPTSSAGNIHVIYLRNAQAVKMAEILRAIYSGDTATATQTASPATAGTTGSVQGQSSSMSSPGIIQADAATNSIIITAPDAIYNNLRAAVEKLDVRRAQVYIEALIVEVTSDKAAELGVQWQSLSGLGKSGTQGFGGTNFGSKGNIIGVAASPATSVANLGEGLNIGVIKGTLKIPGTDTEILNLGMLLHALASDSSTNILSTPTLLTLDNEESKIVVGQNVPFITGSYSNTGTSGGSASPFQTIERKDVGLTLKIKPQISEGGAVRLQISQEVSSVQPATAATAATSDIVTNKRSIDSTVLVDDGKIIVIGGLIQDSVNDGVSKVPLLGDIPFIGGLFRYNKRSRSKTNLMVFLRPTVLRDEESANSLSSNRYDYIQGEQARVKTTSGILPDFGSPSLPPGPSTPVAEVATPATP
ncbi:MAG: type II secretion system secretin GspD [Georgfuchsia sp.]